MVTNLGKTHSLISNWVSELRSIDVQKDRMRFRKNVERIGEVIAYEISKHLPSQLVNVQTPLGTAPSKLLQQQPVLATILRAGLPLHQGLLNYFDKADSAFIAAYRKHHADGSFEINLEYLSCPSIKDRILIMADPMLATGASLVKSLEYIKQEGLPSTIHIVVVIASTIGIEFVQLHEPNAHIWCAAIDDELTAKGYIVPGLGDAGDLTFGQKNQQ
ncbi:MAG TPA: uracil phosphoribosyltransferase [Chitinophagaceae bacterium]|nr:uracil phosphoribosyltransferase [Chitinophagaceae bacterium]